MLFAVGTFIIRTDGHLWQGRTSGPTLPKGKKEAGGLEELERVNSAFPPAVGNSGVPQ